MWFKTAENWYGGVFLYADSEYRVKKMIWCTSRDLSSIFFQILIVMTFESTHTPLEVHLLLGNFIFISVFEPIDYGKIIKKILGDAHQVENFRFSKIFSENFQKLWK